jgi:hypothetical protein
MKLTLTCVIPPLEPAKMKVRTAGYQILTSFADDFLNGCIDDFGRVHFEVKTFLGE